MRDLQARLIRRKAELDDRSIRQIVLIAERKNGGVPLISHSRVATILQRGLSGAIGEKALRGLAYGLDLPLDEVRRLAAQEIAGLRLDVQLPGQEDVLTLVAHADEVLSRGSDESFDLWLRALLTYGRSTIDRYRTVES